eukprot:TRINITY_DN97455_c0_g1_i1.p1 TRINITY_DN97455_c0_g1~~TRINITY_DN97455_c0_g1_i1.p1  ORF type:complete len:391 (-),score=47.48 TRINITY_DN97455_c0_g1_i1:147-1319(-)
MSQIEETKEEPIHTGRKFDGTVLDLSKIDELTNVDNRKEYLISFSMFYGQLVGMLKRPVDIHILYSFLSVSVTVVPASLLLAYMEYIGVSSFWLHCMGIARLLLGLVQTGGFVLALHYSSHTRIFVEKWAFLDQWVHWVLSPLIGFPSNAYLGHHVIMHHKEDNQIDYDASSTMPYQRDSYFHLLLYILRYTILIPVELPAVLLLRGRHEQCFLTMMGYASWVSVMTACLCTLPVTACWVLLIPFLVLSIAAMRGNSIQHMFVCPDEPKNDYKLCYDLVNDPSNCIKFNDSFHIEHHLSPLTHWAELPHLFIKRLEAHKANDSFIFTGICPETVSGCVMGGRLEELAEHYVYIGQKSGICKEALVVEMKKRLQPIRKFTGGSVARTKKAT